MPASQLGEIRVDRIADWDGPFLTAMQMFPDASREAIEPHFSWLAPSALSADALRRNLPAQSYLLRSNRHTPLIDTCIGCRTFRTRAGCSPGRSTKPAPPATASFFARTCCR